MAVTRVGRQQQRPGSLPARTRGAPPRALALQRAIGNRAFGRLVQREVRIAGGKQRVNEAHYTSGPGKAVGGRIAVSAMIRDPVKRVFTGQKELEDYANGRLDHIGDVKTKSAGTFWFRLPKDKLTVLGEIHDNPDGNAEDVILGLGTSRFMYEAINEMTPTQALALPYSGTKARLGQVDKGLRLAARIDRSKFAPDLENIVVKALTGTSIMRNEYIAAPAADRADAQWKARASKTDYSYGERVALYLSMAIHVAADVATHNFGVPNSVESLYVGSGRRLTEVYLKHQKVLDALMTAKDGDDLIGIYELTSPGGFANLPAINEFTLAFHEYGARYISQLGSESGNKELDEKGEALRANPGAKLDALSPIRELIMWQKITAAKGYLLIGMGDAHRQNLKPKLDAAGIPHERADEALERQRKDIEKDWKP